MIKTKVVNMCFDIFEAHEIFRTFEQENFEEIVKRLPELQEKFTTLYLAEKKSIGLPAIQIEIDALSSAFNLYNRHIKAIQQPPKSDLYLNLNDNLVESAVFTPYDISDLEKVRRESQYFPRFMSYAVIREYFSSNEKVILYTLFKHAIQSNSPAEEIIKIKKQGVTDVVFHYPKDKILL